MAWPDMRQSITRKMLTNFTDAYMQFQGAMSEMTQEAHFLIWINFNPIMDK